MLTANINLFSQKEDGFYKVELSFTTGINYSNIHSATGVINPTIIGFNSTTISNTRGGFGFNFGGYISYRLFDRIYIKSGIDLIKVSTFFDEEVSVFATDVGLVREENGTTKHKALINQLSLILKYSLGEKRIINIGSGFFWRDKGLPAGGKRSYLETNYWNQNSSGEWISLNAPYKININASDGSFVKSSFGYLFEIETNFTIKQHYFFIGLRFQSELRKGYFKQDKTILYIGGIKKFHKRT